MDSFSNFSNNNNDSSDLKVKTFKIKRNNKQLVSKSQAWKLQLEDEHHEADVVAPKSSDKEWKETPRPVPAFNGVKDPVVAQRAAARHAKHVERVKQEEELQQQVAEAKAKEEVKAFTDKKNRAARRRRRNRENYLRRKNIENIAAGAHPTSLLAPANPLTLNQRVSLHARHHKCPHGIRPNVIFRAQEQDKYNFGCCCLTSKRVAAKDEDVKCLACGFTSSRAMVNTATNNYFVVCARCLRSNFLTPAPNHFYDVDAVTPGLRITIDPDNKNPHQAQDMPTTRFDQFLEKNVVTLPKTRKETRAEFFRALQGKSTKKTTWSTILRKPKKADDIPFPSANEIRDIESVDQGEEVQSADQDPFHVERARIVELRPLITQAFHENDWPAYGLYYQELFTLTRRIGDRITMRIAPYNGCVRICIHGASGCDVCSYHPSESDTEYPSDPEQDCDDDGSCCCDACHGGYNSRPESRSSDSDDEGPIQSLGPRYVCMKNTLSQEECGCPECDPDAHQAIEESSDSAPSSDDDYDSDGLYRGEVSDVDQGTIFSISAPEHDVKEEVERVKKSLRIIRQHRIPDLIDRVPAILQILAVAENMTVPMRQDVLEELVALNIKLDGYIAEYLSRDVASDDQGGAVSSAATVVKTTAELLKDKILEYKDKIFKSVNDFLDKIGTTVANTWLGKIISRVVYAMRHVIGLFFHNVKFATATNLYNIIFHLKEGNYFSAILSLFSHVALMKDKEIEDFHKFIAVIPEYPNTLRRFREQVAQLSADNLCRFVFSNMYRNANDDHRVDPSQLLKDINASMWFSNPLAEADKTKVDCDLQGSESLLTMFFGLLESVPSSLRQGARVLSAVAKDVLPGLHLLKTAGDLASMTNKIFQSIINYVTGSFAKASDWLENEIATAGTPAHKLVQQLVAYRIAVAAPEHTSTNTTNLRTQFYADLAAAHKHYEGHKFFVKWLELAKKLEDAMNIAPKASERKFEPCVLTLSGQPGLGKSTIWPVIVASEVLTPDDKNPLETIKSKTYTWTTESDYQVGMTGKDIVLFDDFQQDKTTNVEALSFIHLATTAPFAINSPNITGPEIKGMFAEPKIIVLCTNQDYLASGALIASAEAIKRRYEVEFEIKQRYDPAQPNAKIAIIKACNLYQQLVGKQVSLVEMKAVFQTVYRRKRANFEKTRELVSKETISALHVNAIDFNAVSTFEVFNTPAWQLNGDFISDLNTLVMPADKQVKVNLSKVNQHLLANDPAIASVHDQRPSTSYSAMLQSDMRLEKGDDPANFQVGGVWHFNMYYDLISILLTRGVILAAEASVGAFVIDTLYELAIDAKQFFSVPRLKDTFKKFLKCALVSIGLATMFVTMFGWWTRNPYEEDQSGTTRTARNNAKHQAPPPTVTSADQATAEDFDALAHVFRNATVTLFRPDTNLRLNAIMVGGTWLLANRHFFCSRTSGEYMPETATFSVMKPEWGYISKSVHFERSCCVELKGSVSPDGERLEYRTDIVLYKLPHKQFSSAKNIVPHFWDGSENLMNAEVCRHDMVPFNSSGQWDPQFNNHTGRVLEVHARTWRTEGGVNIFHVAARANYTDRYGSCGTLVRLPGQQSPLLGIHMAASKDSSLFHLVTRQQLEEAMTRVIELPSADQAVIEPPPYLPEPSTLYPIALLERPLFQPTKTDLQPSLLFETLGPHTTEPSILSWDDERNTELPSHTAFMRKLFEGFAPRAGGFDEHELRWASETMRDQMIALNKTSTIGMKRLTLHEAINGLPIKDNVRMDMTSSCGYPYGGKKSDYFDVIGENIVPRPKIIADYQEAVNCIDRGEIPFLPFALTLKDERLKLAKISSPRTRIFACGNVIHYLLMRTHFYTRLMQIYHAPVGSLWCIVSLDRLSVQWHHMASHMLHVGDRAFDFDFKNYDRTLSHLLIYETTEILLTGACWLGDLQKHTLIEMLATPYSVHGRHLFKSCGINMSGNLLTFVLNCTANELMHRAAYFHLASRLAPNHATILAYNANVRGIRGGDDTVTVVSDAVSEWYNGITVSNFLTARGMEVTSAEKDQPIVKYKNFFECSFLKNKTSYNFLGYGLYLPLPDLPSLIESCYWMRLNRYNRDPVKATSDNANAALRGIFFHGKEIFDKIRSAFLEKEPRLTLLSFHELDCIWSIYHHFPQSHPDEPTAAQMQDDFRSDVQTMRVTEDKESPTNNMNTIQSIDQSDSMDKQQIIEQTETPDVPVDQQPSVPIVENTQANPLGDAEKTESTKVGTTVQDSANTTIKPVVTGSQKIKSDNYRAEAYMNDAQWNLSMLYNKYTQFDNVVWEIGQPQDYVLASISIPSGLMITPALKAPVDLTKFFRFSKLTMKVVVKPSPMYAGSLVQCFFPYGQDMTTERAINMGAPVLKLSQDEGVEFTIPFRYHRGFLVVPHEDIGTYQLRVLTQLRSGADALNNISVALYFCFEGAEFKVPDIIPATRYFSHKLDTRDKKAIRSYDQSGPNTELPTSVCNINDNPSQLPSTKLCAGAGAVPSLKVGHFQDAVADLVTPLKRFRMISRFQSDVKENSLHTHRIDVIAAYRATMDYLADMYTLFRGSIDLRIHMYSVTVNDPTHAGKSLQGFVRYVEDDEVHRDHQDMFIDFGGYHRFDNENVAQIQIPYIFNTFVLPTEQDQQLDPVVDIMVYNYYNQPGTYVIEIESALADDFHVGVYRGTSGNSLVNNTIMTVGDLGTQPIVYFQGGVHDYSNRAIETLLPIEETVSALGSLLDAMDVTYQPDQVMHRKFQNSIFCDGPRYGDRLKSTNHNGMNLPDGQCFGTSTSEANIHNLMTNTKSLVARTVWKDSDIKGTTLFSAPVGPWKDGTSVHDIVPFGFQYFNGGMRLIFDVICSQMHRGQLSFCYAIGRNEAPAYEDMTQSYFCTMDISNGRGTIAVDFPYLSNYPYCAINNNFTHNIGSQPFTCGTLSVFVENALRSTAAANAVVDICIYKTYLPDFKLAVWAPLGASPLNAKIIKPRRRTTKTVPKTTPVYVRN